MRVTTPRIAAAILPTAVVICAFAVSGCGSASPSHIAKSVDNIVDPVAQAATVSNSSAGYAMKFNLSIESPALPSALNATGTGSFSSSTRQGTVNLSFNFGSIPGVSAVLGSSTLQIQELINGQTFYIKLPDALASKLPGGKPWLSIDLSQIGSAAGIPGLGSLVNNPTSSNPGAMLEYLRAVSGGVTKVGTATIDGRQTTEYTANIDFAKYPNLVPAAQRAQAQQAVAAVEKLTKVKAFPVNVWVDSQHFVRRMQFTFTEQLPTGGQSVKTAMTLDMVGYGPQPAPAFPPASQVGDVSSLLAAAGSAASAGG